MKSLAPEDRAEFIGDSLTRSIESVPVMMVIGILAYASFVVFDFICLPDLFNKFTLLRFSLVFGTSAYLWALYRGRLPFGVHSKLLLTVPCVIATSYMVTKVPKDFVALETCTEVMLILSTASLFPWLPSEFFMYGLGSILGSALIWQWFSDFTLSEMTFQYFVVTNTIAVSTLTVFVQTDQKVSLFIANKNVMRHERAKLDQKIVAIESRLAESDRNAYLAHHLGLFLHEMKNIIFSLDLMVEQPGKTRPEADDLLANIKNSNELIRKRIEAFLGKVKFRSTNKQIVTIASEVASILPILEYDGKKNGITINYFATNSLDQLEIYSVPGAVSVLLFDITRNAINAITEARHLYPGPTFSGIINVTISTLGEAVQFAIEDNGIGLSDEARAAFDTGEVVPSSSGKRIGIGTLGMRHEAKENHFHISLTPRLGGGTLATLIVPLHRQGAHFAPSSDARKLA